MPGINGFLRHFLYIFSLFGAFYDFLYFRVTLNTVTWLLKEITMLNKCKINMFLWHEMFNIFVSTMLLMIGDIISLQSGDVHKTFVLLDGFKAQHLYQCAQ